MPAIEGCICSGGKQLDELAPGEDLFNRRERKSAETGGVGCRVTGHAPAADEFRISATATACGRSVLRHAQAASAATLGVLGVLGGEIEEVGVRDGASRPRRPYIEPRGTAPASAGSNGFGTRETSITGTWQS
ncbi:MAG TPA: hypothetical protein VF832_04675 [Longimicrobiales bacterium]